MAVIYLRLQTAAMVLLLLIGQSAAQIAGKNGHSVLDIGGPGTGAYQFINFMKTCSFLRSDKYPFPAILNADGYPQSTPSETINCGINIPLSYHGDWVIRWEGQFGKGNAPGVWLTGAFGPFVVKKGDQFVTNSSNGIKLTGTNGYVVFKPTTPHAFNIQFSTTGAISHITDIDIYRADQEIQYNGGEIFNPDYVAMLRRLNPRIIRFLGWNNINSSNRSRQAYDTPTHAMTYTSHQWVPGAWGGTISSNGGAGVAYTGAAAPDTPATYTQGETYQGFIIDANTTTTPTLDVGGRGTKPIKNIALFALSPRSLAANSLNTFVYDAKLDAWMWKPGGLIPSVPLTIQIALCNAVGRDGWFQIPHLFEGDDAEAFGKLVRDSLNSSNKAYFEYSNEVWNYSFGFAQTFWALARAKLAGFPGGNVDDYYALQDRRLLGRITQIWPTGDKRLRRVSTDLVVAYQPFIIANRLGGVDLTLDKNGNYTKDPSNIVTNYSQAPNRPVDYIDVLSYADYFRGSNVPYSDPAYVVLERPENIVGITNANPGIVTIYGHGYSNGDRVKLSADIGGMMDLRNAYVTIANKTENTFEISNVVDASGKSISSDTRSYGKYTSGGTGARIAHGAIDAVLSAADKYASGNAALMQDALNWFQDDVYRGLRKNSAGVPTLSGGTIEHFKTKIFPDWQATAAHFDKTIVLYEGAYDGVPVTTVTAARLGIDPAYSAKIARLIEAYKNSELIVQAINDLQEDFISFPNSLYPAWSLDIAVGGDNQPFPWALFSGDLYSKPYKSFDGVASFNSKQ